MRTTWHFADYEQMHKLLAEKAEPVSNMARVAVRAGKGKESEDRYRALVEIASPREPRSDESLPTDGMSVEELMLRAGYAANLEKRDLEIEVFERCVGCAAWPCSGAGTGRFADEERGGGVVVDHAESEQGGLLCDARRVYDAETVYG